MCSGGQFSGSVQLINETRSNSPTYRISSCLRGIEPTLSHARAPYSAQALPLDYAPEDDSFASLDRGEFLNKMMNFRDCTSPSFKLKYLIIESDEGGIAVYDQGHQGGKSSFSLSVVAHDSNKRLSPYESDSSHGDRNFKRVRACPSRLEDTNSHVVEISDSVGSPSRTLTALIKGGKLSGIDLDCASSLEEEVQIEKLCTQKKNLEVLLEVTKEEVEESRLGALTSAKDFDTCNDADLLNADGLIDLEQKKEHLEAMRQDLINYKLCLD
ncbi:hypothetical protein RND71_012492 [Anisodus tanguticus]|uniref:Uncharacterized protein n=1 Tax=Anisodus tanguticus TaxID=243964 RepID=A0AAE1SEQ8_9SOLA|nr:hypothetical protein RND71_012492 [Anisodus tanguticus]